MSADSRPAVDPVVVLREESDEWAILFNPDTALAVGINPIGVAVWRLLDGSRTVDDIVALIHELFDEVPGTARGDLESFIADLKKCGFVSCEPGEEAG